MRVEYRPSALRDLAAIAAGFGFDDASAARRLHARLLDACEGLADFPQTGRRTPPRRSARARHRPPYVIIYRPQPDAAVIFRIVHGARLR